MDKSNEKAKDRNEPNTKSDISVKSADATSKKPRQKKPKATDGDGKAAVGAQKKTTAKAADDKGIIEEATKTKKKPVSKKQAEKKKSEMPIDTAVQLEMDIAELSMSPAPEVSPVEISPAPEAEQKDAPLPEKEEIVAPDANDGDGEPDTEGEESPDAPKGEEMQEITLFDISEESINALTFDDEKAEKREEAKTADDFDDFLMGYRRQISEMLRANREEGEASGDEKKEPAPEKNDADDLKIPFPSLTYREDEQEDTEDADDAVQLTIDPSSVPFAPLKESKKEEAPEEKKYCYDPKKPGFVNNIFDILEIFVFTVAIVLLVSSFFFRHSEVDGGSMDTTLSDGEHLIISDFFYTPKRGDIVVFEDYTLDKKIPIVKRVIGIAGDTVRVENENGTAVVYLNGERLDESYTTTDGYDNHPTGEWEVKEGEVFVMGDHRNVSWDGRSFGTISVESILGKVILRIYPFESFGKVK